MGRADVPWNCVRLRALLRITPVLGALGPESIDAHRWALERGDLIMAQSPNLEVQILALLSCGCVAWGRLLNLSGPGTPHP